MAVIAVVTAASGEEKIPNPGTLEKFSYLGYILPVFTDTDEWARAGSFILNWFSFGGFIGLLSPVYMVVNRSPPSLI